MAVIVDLTNVVAKDDQSMSSQTVSLATNRILNVTVPTTGEAAKFSGVLTAVEVEDIQGNSRRKARYLSTTAIATVKTAIG